MGLGFLAEKQRFIKQSEMFVSLTLHSWGKIHFGSTTKKTFQAVQIKTNISGLRAAAGMNEGDYRLGFFPQEEKKKLSFICEFN